MTDLDFAKTFDLEERIRRAADDRRHFLMLGFGFAAGIVFGVGAGALALYSGMDIYTAIDVGLLAGSAAATLAGGGCHFLLGNRSTRAALG